MGEEPARGAVPSLTPSVHADAGAGKVDVSHLEVEATTIGDLLGASLAVGAEGPRLGAMGDLFCLPEMPLLPAPAPTAVAALGPQRGQAHRSVRLAAKPRLPAVDMAVQLLHRKLGIVRDLPFVQARQLYVDSYKTELPDFALTALATLLEANIPSITAADEALLALAGPGGGYLATPAALDVDARA